MVDPCGGGGSFGEPDLKIHGGGGSVWGLTGDGGGR